MRDLPHYKHQYNNVTVDNNNHKCCQFIFRYLKIPFNAKLVSASIQEHMILCSFNKRIIQNLVKL